MAVGQVAPLDSTASGAVLARPASVSVHDIEDMAVVSSPEEAPVPVTAERERAMAPLAHAFHVAADVGGSESPQATRADSRSPGRPCRWRWMILLSDLMRCLC